MRKFPRRWFGAIPFLPLWICLTSPLPGQDQHQERRKPWASLRGDAISEAQTRENARAELESLELQIARQTAIHTREVHEVLAASLNQLLENKLLAAEAAKRGISVNELLAEEVPANRDNPAEEDIEAFYEGNKDRIRMSRESAIHLIALHLKEQQGIRSRKRFLEKLEKEYEVVRTFEPLRFSVPTSGHPSVGPAAAPVTLLVFSDFQCPYCRSHSETMKKILADYAGKVRLVFRQFPLAGIHENAERAAGASLCADDQKHFWEMHDLLFGSQEDLGEKKIEALAAGLGIDMDAFRACMKSDRPRERIRADLREGSRAGTDVTPALFINGRFFGGARTYEEIAESIDEELSFTKPNAQP